MEKAQRLMNYVMTYPNTYIRYYTSDMIINIDSDAAYLVAPRARSRVVGYYYLSSIPHATKHPRFNGAILV